MRNAADRFNYDVERAKRCVILYSTPAGVFPFCTYNCGPEYRSIVERQAANGEVRALAPARAESKSDQTVSENR